MIQHRSSLSHGVAYRASASCYNDGGQSGSTAYDMLYLVATPIGNLGDITLRALEVLREVDVVASEDTRKTGLLLKHFEIKKPQIAFHEHNERQAGERIVGLLKQGKSVAVVTNADHALDRSNRARAVADLRKQAASPLPMRLAREAGRQAVERSFALPLQAAGFDNAKVVARYPTEGSEVTEPLDRSRSYNDVLDEARNR